MKNTRYYAGVKATGQYSANTAITEAIKLEKGVPYVILANNTYSNYQITTSSNTLLFSAVKGGLCVCIVPDEDINIQMVTIDSYYYYKDGRYVRLEAIQLMG
jgi:hypothetical protein